MIFFGLSAASLLAMDRWAFHLRTRFVASDVGRWHESQWLQRRRLLQQKQSIKPVSLLFLGDSSVAYDIRPSLIDPDGFNLSRLSLHSTELGELDMKLESMLSSRPKAVFLGMMWFEFLEVESESSFLNGNPPPPKKVLSSFYEQPNLSQQLLLPGSRVARYLVEARIDDTRVLSNTTSRIAVDGSAEVSVPTPLNLQLSDPLGFKDTKPGWFDQTRLLNLKEFLSRGRAQGVPQYFVFMPLRPGFREKYSNAFGPDHAKWKKGVSNLYGRNVFDLEDALPDARYYRDGTHLNSEGAILFTGLLKDQIRARLDAPPASDVENKSR